MKRRKEKGGGFIERPATTIQRDSFASHMTKGKSWKPACYVEEVHDPIKEGANVDATRDIDVGRLFFCKRGIL